MAIPSDRPFLAVSLNHVVLAMPLDGELGRLRPAAAVGPQTCRRNPSPQGMYRFRMATRQADDLEGLSRSEVLRASPRMFDSALFEKFSRVHWSVPPIIFVPVITIMLIEGFVHGVGWMAPVWLDRPAICSGR